jgi:hypothetical protein
MGAGLEQLDLNDADAAADVEQRPTADAQRLERFNEQPCGAGWSAFAIVRQFLRSFARIELNLNPLTLAAGHTEFPSFGRHEGPDQPLAVTGISGGVSTPFARSCMAASGEISLDKRPASSGMPSLEMAKVYDRLIVSATLQDRG